METLYPSYLMSKSNWFVQERHNSEWSREENKRFESALAIYDEDTPDRWLKVAAMVPGKTVYDVIKQYRELEEDVCKIEAGRVPIPGYLHSCDDAHRRRPPSSKGCDHERKKGVPWTEDEHRRFLMGLGKYGKGDWRNISRNFVVTKTPTQVASHAQKYFIRQKLGGGGKDKRRPSIHDITIASNTVSTTPDMNKPHVFNVSPMLTTSMPKVQLDWNHHVDEYRSLMVFNPNLDHVFRPSLASKSLNKLHGQDLYDCAFHEGHKDLKNPAFRTAPLDFKKEAVYGVHAL